MCQCYKTLFTVTLPYYGRMTVVRRSCHFYVAHAMRLVVWTIEKQSSKTYIFLPWRFLHSFRTICFLIQAPEQNKKMDSGAKVDIVNTSQFYRVDQKIESWTSREFWFVRKVLYVSLSLTYTHIRTHYLSHTISHTCTHTRTCMHTYRNTINTHTHTHTHTTLSLSQSLSLSPSDRNDIKLKFGSFLTNIRNNSYVGKQ